ncbi:MAG TPA: zinc ribbon domain-containing protein [Pyrinomonadaceae bacterium]|nr:zinc ribbon domain-containing protein [Pyrinomonadaceae bacterium]
MYCQTCGSALTHGIKFCNRCGTQLVAAGEKSVDKTAHEKRLDDYLDGVFWISVFGLAFVIGGSVILKKSDFSNVVIILYAVLSTTIFLINFGLNLSRALSIMRSVKEDKLAMPPAQDTRELPPPRMEPVMRPAASVTENTTRSFEPVNLANPDPAKK